MDQCAFGLTRQSPGIGNRRDVIPFCLQDGHFFGDSAEQAGKINAAGTAARQPGVHLMIAHQSQPDTGFFLKDAQLFQYRIIKVVGLVNNQQALRSAQLPAYSPAQLPGAARHRHPAPAPSHTVLH